MSIYLHFILLLKYNVYTIYNTIGIKYSNVYNISGRTSLTSFVFKNISPDKNFKLIYYFWRKTTFIRFVSWYGFYSPVCFTTTNFEPIFYIYVTACMIRRRRVIMHFITRTIHEYQDYKTYSKAYTHLTHFPTFFYCRVNVLFDTKKILALPIHHLNTEVCYYNNWQRSFLSYSIFFTY